MRNIITSAGTLVVLALSSIEGASSALLTPYRLTTLNRNWLKAFVGPVTVPSSPRVRLSRQCSNVFNRRIQDNGVWDNPSYRAGPRLGGERRDIWLAFAQNALDEDRLSTRVAVGKGKEAGANPLSRRGGASTSMSSKEDHKQAGESNQGNMSGEDLKGILTVATALVPLVLGIALLADKYGLADSIAKLDVKAILGQVESRVSDLGPWGYVLFAAVYVAAEVLAVPAMPLTASSGYLFGVVNGTMVVLISATIAAALSFQIGRTLLRSTVEQWMEKYPKFQAFDSAIGQEGFKIILLLRLSPIFPFALSNYMYGLTAVRFWPYIGATLLGFLPGTVAYVYSGQLGRSLSEGASGVPWYTYVGAAVGFGLLTKLLSEVANKAIAEYDETGGSSDDELMK